MRPIKVKNTVLLFLLLISLFFLIFTCDKATFQKRERAVLPMVYASSAEFDVPVAMILAVIRSESNFHPKAISRAGAIGLMQLMPETFLWLCKEELMETHTAKEIAYPEINIRFGTYYLSYLYKKFGNWHTALAAYNAGEGRVTDWLSDPALSNGEALIRIPYPETASYVKKTESYYYDYLDHYPIKGEQT